MGKITLFHTGFSGVGGAEVLAVAQARALVALGHRLDVLSFAFETSTWCEAFRGLDHRELPKRDWTQAMMFWREDWKLRRRAVLAARALRGLRPDVVLAHHPNCVAMLAAEGLPALKAWYCHEPPRKLYPESCNRSAFEALREGRLDLGAPGVKASVAAWARPDGKRIAQDQAGVSRLDVLMANSEFCRESACRVYGRQDVQVVYPMVSFPEASPRAHGIDRSGLQVLTQSRLGGLKNIHTLLRGFASSRSALGTRPMLHVVGEGGERDYLEALARELGISEAVRFHGFLDQARLEVLQSACDVFALVPWDEPFGMVFPESAARGLLLLGPDHGGPAEILDHGRYGWMAQAWEPLSVGAALKAIWATPDGELDRRREAADAACRVRYAPGVIAPRLAGLLRL